MAVAVVLIASVVILSLALFLLQKRKLQYWARRGVVADEPHIIFGNLDKVASMQQALHEFVCEQYHKHTTQPVVGFYGLSKPLLIIRDLDIVKDIAIKDFDKFTNRAFHLDLGVDPLAGRVMFMSRDERWRSIRKKSIPAFSSGKLRSMHPRVKAVGKEAMNVYAQDANDGEKSFNIREYCMRYAVDVITSCAFGSEGNALKSPDTSVLYQVLGNTLTFEFKQGVAINLILLVRPLYLLLGRIGFTFLPAFVYEKIRKVVHAAYSQRVENNIRQDDIFDMICWSEEPVFQGIENKTAAAFMNLIGSSETSAQALTFAMYELARQKDIQHRLRSEIKETLQKHNGVADFDTINKIEYLDLVIKETLRLWPIFPAVDRTCDVDYHINGTNITIEKGTLIFIPLGAIQRDSAYFSEPNRFNPERFRPGTSQFPDMAYMPFGVGPRRCLGYTFALMSLKSYLVQLLPSFEIDFSEDTPREVTWNKKAVTLLPEPGIKLKLTPLEH